MGMKTKQVSGDQWLDWGQTLLKSGTAELSKPPFTRPQQPPPQQYSEPLNCPRCGSTNTKFCYYNNYNKSQPRHFCKSCKRHWTKGGTLRNVPAGGGRKNKRPKTSNTTITTAAAATRAKVPTNLEPRKRHFQKNMSNILYQALIHSSSRSLHNTTDGVNMSIPGKPFLESNGTISTTGLNASAPQNPNTEFPFSSYSSTTFEVNNTSMINPTSFQSSNDHIDHYAKNLDSMEESTITTLDIPMALSNYYWNWNEINGLASSAGLNIAWNDVYAEINKSLD